MEVRAGGTHTFGLWGSQFPYNRENRLKTQGHLLTPGPRQKPSQKQAQWAPPGTAVRATAALGERGNKNNFHKAPWPMFGFPRPVAWPRRCWVPSAWGTSPFGLCRPGSRSCRCKEIEAPSGRGWGKAGAVGPTTWPLCRSEGERERMWNFPDFRKNRQEGARRGEEGTACLSKRQAGEGPCLCLCFPRDPQRLWLPEKATHLVSEGFVSESGLISKDIPRVTEPCSQTLKLAKENKPPAQQWRAAIHRKSE